jgi:hypothetical protein
MYQSIFVGIEQRSKYIIGKRVVKICVHSGLLRRKISVHSLFNLLTFAINKIDDQALNDE